MSLDWNIGKVPNKETVCWIETDPQTKTLNPVTEALIWRSMSLDIGLIEEANIPEWLFRTRYYSRLFGKPLTRHVDKCRFCGTTKPMDGKWEPWKTCTHEEADSAMESFDFTVEDLKAHCGLYTNVRTLSRAGFLKKVHAQLAHEIERGISRDNDNK